MGRYLLNNKVYDTDKAEEIIKYRKAVKHNGLVFDTYPQYIHTLCKVEKKWKNRYYKIQKQLRTKNKELEMLKDIKEIAESKVTELNPIRISKNESVIK